jgi:hypothetical protein
MTDLSLLLRLQARVSAFLAELSRDRMIALIEGRATLAVVEDAARPGAGLDDPARPGAGLGDATRPGAVLDDAARPGAVLEDAARRPGSATTRSGPRPPRQSRPRQAAAASSSASFDAEDVAARLRACETLEQGTELLASLKPKATDLKALAKAFKIAPAPRKEDTAKKILNLAVGSRGKHAALRQG